MEERRSRGQGATVDPGHRVFSAGQALCLDNDHPPSRTGKEGAIPSRFPSRSVKLPFEWNADGVRAWYEDTRADLRSERGRPGGMNIPAPECELIAVP